MYKPNGLGSRLILVVRQADKTFAVLCIFDELQKKYLVAEGMEKLKINSELNGLKAIVDSNGLGGFYCLNAQKL